MPTIAEVIAIYAAHGIELGTKKQTAEQVAFEDIVHVNSFNVSCLEAIQLIEGYAAQEACERQCDGNEAREAELDRD